MNQLKCLIIKIYSKTHKTAKKIRTESMVCFSDFKYYFQLISLLSLIFTFLVLFSN